MSLLPSNATLMEKAFDEMLQTRISDLAIESRHLWNPDLCPAGLLSWLAWSMGVTHWDGTWSTAVKRQMIKDSVQLRFKAGTAWAIETAIKNITAHDSVFCHEWFEYEGSPYHFTLNIDLAGATPGQALSELVNQLIAVYKNARSELDNVYFFEAQQSPAYVGVQVMHGGVITIKAQ